MPSDPWLKLALAPDIGPATCRQLLDKLGTAAAIGAASRAELLACGLSHEQADNFRNPDSDKLARAEAWLREPGHHMLHWEDDRYPPLLKDIPDSPPVLFVSGNPDILSLPQIAIVGSRNATAGGRENAHQFALHLAEAGFVITSGLAEGVDAAAHAGTLAAGGKTIAVLGTGPDLIYPASNQSLAQRITETGALVTEFPPGMPARRDHFPRRNRIISGLSLGVLVVEAGMRSGSLITARLAGNYGREVFAVPGSIHSSLSKGCHRLIKQGATLVETSADIVAELGAITGSVANSSRAPAAPAKAKEEPDEDYAKLLRSMGHEPVDIPALIRRSGLTAAELSSMLLILELEGRVESMPGGRFQQLTGWTKSHE
jgi:DNA processing protein